MPRRRAASARFDFRGGVNRSFSPDVLDPTEVRRAEHVRLGEFGALTKATGTQRAHTGTAGGAHAVYVADPYDAPTGQMLVLVNPTTGTLYYKLLPAAALSSLAMAGLASSARPRFAPFRVGSSIELYIAAGSLYRFTGSAFAAVTDGPTGVVDVASYKSRLFACAGKRLYWSQRAVPHVFTVGANLGGFADVETYDTDDLVALARAGSSLLLFKENNISRYRGVSIDQIRIDTETEGVSDAVGCIAKRTVVRLPGAVFFLSAEGPMVANESGVQECGLKIERDIERLERTLWADCHAAYSRRRREVHLYVPQDGASQIDNLYVWNVRTRAWSGPWPRAAASSARYEEPDGTERLVLGGYDGIARRADTDDALEDKAYDGTGGTPLVMRVELPPELAGDPGREKSLQDTFYVMADLGAAGQLTVSWASERGSGSAVVASEGPGIRSYPVRLQARGRRIVLTLEEATAELVQIVGILSEPTLGEK